MSYLLRHNARNKQCKSDIRSTSNNYPHLQKQQQEVTQNLRISKVQYTVQN
jgi:hypothetical protein